MDIKTRLENAIKEAAVAAIAAGDFQADTLPEVLLEVPPQKEFGDYATNFAMQTARAARTNPRKVAEALVKYLQRPWLERCEIAGPGFINFYLRPEWVHDLLASILAQGDAYGCTQTGNGQKIQVEFVSANPTGLLHVGHGRGAAFGSALVNVLRAAGYEVQAEYYINDAGNQIDNLAASVNARYLELLGQEVAFPEDGYRGEDIITTAQGLLDRDGDKYLSWSEAERVAHFKEVALAEKLAILKDHLAAFNVHFDVWFSERTLHQSGAVDEACAILKDKGQAYEKDGALWLKSTAYGDDKDRVIIRDNGVPTYLAADIAYHRNKAERGFDKIINIWGADHHGYICRVKASMEALGYEAERLEVLILQMVSLYRDGQLVKMSKRTGQSVTLDELMEEVGRDAARYFFIMRSIDSQLDFDIDLARSRSNENPVYYVQYAHARICSIFRQTAEAGIVMKALDTLPLHALREEAEMELIKKLGDFAEEIDQAARERAPHRIARYVHEVASLFHSFYNQCRIIGAEPDVQLARLGLVTATQQVLRRALGILGVEAPEKM